MMNGEVTDLEETRQAVLQRLRDWAAERPDEEFAGLASGGPALTRHDVLEAIEQQTPLGEQLLKQWHKLAINHIMDVQLSD